MKRADALKNRSDLILAARAVFSEQGVSAPLEAVRQRANVGRATLYRHFPDRNSLLLALLDEAIDGLEQHSGDFMSMLRHVASEMATDEAVHAIWAEPGLDAEVISQRRFRLQQLLTGPLCEAQAAGHISADLSIDDLLLLLRMIGGASRMRDPAERQGASIRALAILEKGLHPRAQPKM